MTSTATPVNNGVNVDALLGARTALTDAPEAANFNWRATCEWRNGTHSTSLTNFHGSEIPPTSALFPPASPYSPDKGQALVFFSGERFGKGRSIPMPNGSSILWIHFRGRSVCINSSSASITAG